MFTGLVEGLATITAVWASGLERRLRLEFHFDPPDVAVGDSISINGCCLTVVVLEGDQFEVQAGDETLSRTTLGSLVTGARANVERAVRPWDRLGGHFVTGHVDCVAEVVARDDQADWSTMEFRVNRSWMSQIASKGSVAIDGVSLTVVHVFPESFTVALIPHTLARTTLGQRQVGDLVNLETDILAKYVARALAGAPSPG